jgi:transcriptional regulator GlxA family with amidase domain
MLETASRQIFRQLLLHVMKYNRIPDALSERSERMKFGIFIYDGVEPIDLATYGVLSMARRVAPAIEILTIAPAPGVVNLSNGLRVIADHGIDDAPRCDVLVITGGPGWEAQSKSAATIAFLRAQPAATRIVSVCTGAMILAATGMLDGHKATTKCQVRPPESSPLELMRQRYPAIATQAASVVDCGALTTGGGVSLCIDTMLHVIARELGAPVAKETARILEYSRAWDANREQFPAIVDSAYA